MNENLTISHGFLKNYTGTSKLTADNKNVIVTIEGPQSISAKEENTKPYVLDIKSNIVLSSKDFESMCSSLIATILEKYLVLDLLNFKAINISIYSNTPDLSMICNAVAVACLDAGISLVDMFYSVGESSLFVFSNNKLDFCHNTTSVTDELLKSLEEPYNYIHESLKYAFKDVLEIN